MKNRRNFAGFVFITLFLFSLSPALAQVTFTTDQAQFLADNPEVVSQDFFSHPVPAGLFTNCNSPVNAESNDQCFTPGFILPGIEILLDLQTGPNFFALLGPNFEGSGSPANVLAASLGGVTFDITFPVLGATAVGFVPGCINIDIEGGFCSQALTVEVYGNNDVFLGSTTVDGNNHFNTFLGIESLEAIRRVTILPPASNLNIQGILRVWFGVRNFDIPTLSEWGMIAAAIGLGMAGVLFAARRRRAFNS
jgi:hypothetical protein